MWTGVPGPFLGVFAFLNTVAIWNHSSAALPFGMIMILTCLFLLVNVPLTIIGGIARRNTTTFMTIAITYFQLVGEDHRWWWRSFWSGGVTGVFVFAYSVWYFYTSTDMDEFFQTVFYFGYSAVMSYCSLVMLTFIGSSPHHCPVSVLGSRPDLAYAFNNSRSFCTTWVMPIGVLLNALCATFKAPPILDSC
ncbi:hypothetical protein H257_06385 [Aphanomyces astaci]|uniref:Transmembrane 9 superfamily member n=1 Tax=Aphanomyces astaci TaxID=112090 RepID=W4GMK3_APHAT|nr:hypothetical protein H257_06385 [Aphanomyces astaci]ETV80940.1 hypothetical protein H257_06385 [Aphanomyces astaci]|eukprot:XP_009829887.1 hypothetical protein H257_06385 [Aphanomyces astaci]